MPERMMTHTPGPWIWQSFDGGKTLFLGTPYRGRLVVMDFARLGMQRGGVRFARRSSGDEGGRMEMATVENVESFPDARLIAAAPDLLCACEALVSMIDEHKLAVGGIVDEARSAIAHARGQAEPGGDVGAARTLLEGAIARARGGSQ